MAERRVIMSLLLGDTFINWQVLPPESLLIQRTYKQFMCLWFMQWIIP